MVHFYPFEVSTPHIVYACLGGFVVFFGMFSLFIREKLYIGEACWAFLFGVIIGPYGANIFDPRSWGGTIDATNEITLEFTRVVLAIGVFAIGVELPKAYMQRHWKSLFFLLVPVMTWGWFVSAGLIYALIPNLNFLSSLAVAACLTPTDPILAAAVVGGKYADKHVPAHLRHLLAAESGCNDGAAFPFLYISLYLIIDSTTSNAIEDWFLILWLYEVILGCVWGAMLGFGFRHLMKFCERKDLIDRQSYVAQYVSLALLTIGSTTLLGSDDLLAAFCCGTAFAWDGFFNRQTEAAVFSSVIDLLFNVAAFVFVGAWTPFNQFSDAALSLSVWRLVVIALLVLMLRRLPAMIALYKWIPDVKSFREALFSGHFGPMGIGAIFISTLAAEQLPRPQSPPQGQTEMLAATIQPIVSFMVVTSIAIHGLSIPFFSLSRRVTTMTRTWSRQPSVPDWAMHTRPIVRGQDIVINRDPGEVEEIRRERETSGEEKTAEAATHDGDHAAEPTPKPDNPPDGDDLVAEWKEGPHRIIERRGGPGEEVEVEVQRNFFGPGDTERITQAFRGQHHYVHRAADAFIGGLGMRNAPHEVEHVAHAVEDSAHETGQAIEDTAHQASEAIETTVKDFGHAVEEKAHHAGHALEASTPSSAGESSRTVEEPRHEEEEGWASDTSASGEPKKRAKGKKKTPLIVSRAGRRRSSISVQRPLYRPVAQGGPPRIDTSVAAAGSPRQPSFTSASISASSAGDDSARGRSLPATPQGSMARRARHLRLESLRGSEGARDPSPGRSVRFADGVGGLGGGAHTPRSPLSPPPSQPPSDDEEDSPRGRVVFDLARGYSA
ncbi:hypothetical protein BV25DRAFT_1860149 [Artomyces pyxidatus]|uniref:Uncharacterized protein n=1 Tax=Artomyces pyxidatus TaxID=48021 RepID=A0ACB8STK6_9AGAM|nr:hypothetical protein BV25DRAFT_1860149 [Artomyces pyxidatus]